MAKPKEEKALVRVDPSQMTMREIIDAISSREIPDEVRSLAINNLRLVIADRTAPTANRLKVRRIEAHQTMSSGQHGKQLHIPDRYQSLSNFALVLECGPDVKTVKVGDVIYMWAGAGAILNDEIVLIEEREVQGIVDIGER